MVTIVCDSCKKPAEQVRDQLYFSILHKNLCVNCKESLDKRVKDVVYARENYTLNGYHDVMAQTLDSMCK